MSKGLLLDPPLQLINQLPNREGRTARARLNVSRMSAAVTVQMEGSWVFIVVVDVVVDSGDKLLDATGPRVCRGGGRVTQSGHTRRESQGNG